MDINYKVPTSKNFADAVEDLKISLTEHKFGVLWELNLKDKLEEKGFEFNRNIKILEVCNPGQAKQVLEQDIEVGYFLPCKIIIYENEGSIFIGMPKPTALIAMFENEELVDIAEQVENELKSAIDKAAATVK